MNCPGCQAALPHGSDRCPACGTTLEPVVLGALAPDPSRATPPVRGKGPAPSRDVPALRKRDKPQPAWKDEVRERMRQRKLKDKPEADLPLFREAAPEADAPSPQAGLSAPAGPQPESVALAPELQETPLADAASEFSPEPPVLVPEASAEVELAREIRIDLPREPTADLRLRRFDLPPPSRPEPVTAAAWGETAQPRGEEPADEWQTGDDAPLADLPPVERPAQFGERLQAGGIDAAILGGLYAVIVYFASRAAHASVEALVPAWPWLAGYLAFLGLVYAAWFTGMHGQTPGKMLLGLHVKTHAGECPGWGAAGLRAAAGALGIGLAGLGILPLFFDPARRALHDRLLRTRVVKA